MAAVKRIFKVNGKPFYPLGRHRIYMAGYHVRNEIEIEAHFKATKLCNANTVCLAIFWDQLEPEEGKYDFSSIDTLIAIARKYDIKLILLWFATWKNGVMDYAPNYIKTNPALYKRVIAPTGNSIWVLSSHCQATLEADKKAFAALCKHLKTFDGKEQTVIGLQIENEPGISGSDRDYGPEAQSMYDSQVPGKLTSAMKKNRKGDVYDVWQEAGGKSSGTWSEMFGWEGGGFMTAWSIAAFINEVAKAGKAVHDIPMFINFALNRFSSPGGDSSGAKRLDIYKWAAPDVDLIAPDILTNVAKDHEYWSKDFTEDGYPLFEVEARIDGMFYDIADFNAIGYFVHYDQNEDGSIPPDQQRLVSLTRSAVAAIPLLLKYQGTGKIHAVEEPVMEGGRLRGMQIDLDGYWGMIQFGNSHEVLGYYQPGLKEQQSSRGAGLIIQVSRNEFYLVGYNMRLLLRPKPTLKNMQFTLHGHDMDHPSYMNFVLSVEEGRFNEKDEFIACRQINGDNLRGGIWVGPDDTVMRIITCD